MEPRVRKCPSGVQSRVRGVVSQAAEAPKAKARVAQVARPGRSRDLRAGTREKNEILEEFVLPPALLKGPE